MYEACSAWSWFPKGGHVSLQLRICLYHDSAMERGTFVLTFYFLNIWDYNYTAYGKWFAYPFFHVVTGLMPGVWQMSIASAWVPVLGSKI